MIFGFAAIQSTCFYSAYMICYDTKQRVILPFFPEGVIWILYYKENNNCVSMQYSIVTKILNEAKNF